MASEDSASSQLRETVGTLGALLGEVVESLEGKAVFAHVELARLSARSRREREPGSERRFRRLLAGLSPDEALAVTRAFSSYFSLINLAQRVHRSVDEASAGAASSAIHRAIGAMRDSGRDGPAVLAVLDATLFNPVFTAHPTEAVRNTLLRKEQRMAAALFERANHRNPAISDRALDAIRDEVGIAWQTDEHSAQPTVADELEQLLFYLGQMVYTALPRVFESIEASLRSHFDADLPDDARLVRFGSWVGGDMDGNPNVGPETISHGLSRQREVLIERYRQDVQALFDSLSHSAQRVVLSQALSVRLAEYRHQLEEPLAQMPSRYADMPYRAFLWSIWIRLGACLDGSDWAYGDAAEFRSDLALLEDSLEGHGSTGNRAVRALARRARVFGFHMVALDVRQDGRVHREAVAEAIGDSDYLQTDGTGRLAKIRVALTQPMPSVTPKSGGALERTLAVLITLHDAEREYGTDALGLYIISMARGAEDCLAVLYLARLAGFVDADGNVPMDIAPLFETVDDLQAAPTALGQMLGDDTYARHVQARSGRQFVMLGYSDSSKEAGIAASRWALHEAQLALLDVARASTSPVELTLFHGRGGTISRGGGEPRRGILAEPPGALAGRLRVTEQGEIIGQKYGIEDVAVQTIEGSLAALLERHLLAPLAPSETDAWHESAALVANSSRAAYAALVHDDDGFVPFFRAATPIDVIERMRIGSRPASRKTGGGVENLRAIPWVFAWTQSRHILPGWFGVGSGLAAAIEQVGVTQLRAMANEWQFFAAFLSDIEMVLAKADMGIAAHYASLAGPEGGRVQAILAGEFERTREHVCEILEIDELLDHHTELRRLIALRDPYVDPLSLVQVDMLRRWRETGREDESLEIVLRETVRGIARGMQNTG
jgi:phosphoenolpyruvate carboxylase